jgi:hypothetical protein
MSTYQTPNAATERHAPGETSRRSYSTPRALNERLLQKCSGLLVGNPPWVLLITGEEAKSFPQLSTSISEGITTGHHQRNIDDQEGLIAQENFALRSCSIIFTRLPDQFQANSDQAPYERFGNLVHGSGQLW